MSGGSWSYSYLTVDDAARMMASWDIELSELLGDLSEVCHDCEWADSSDYSKEDGLESIREFRKKWFEAPREQRLQRYVDEGIERLRSDLARVMGGE